MSYRKFLKAWIITMFAVSAAHATTVPPSDVDHWADVSQAAHPMTYPSVPLPTGVYGSGACVLLVVALRMSRHRRWVTLR